MKMFLAKHKHHLRLVLSLVIFMGALPFYHWFADLITSENLSMRDGMQRISIIPTILTMIGALLFMWKETHIILDKSEEDK